MGELRLFVNRKGQVQWRDRAGHFVKPQIADSLWSAANAWARQTLATVRAATPVRTGATRRAWRAEYERAQLRVAVTNALPTALWLLRGTRRHNIPNAFGDPSLGTSGRFMGYFHPGQQPHEELVRAVEDAEHEGWARFTDAGVQIIRDLVEG